MKKRRKREERIFRGNTTYKQTIFNYPTTRILSSHIHVSWAVVSCSSTNLRDQRDGGSVVLAWFKAVAVYHQGRHLLFPSKVFTHYFSSVSLSLFLSPSGSFFCQSLQADKKGMQNALQAKTWDLMMYLSSRLWRAGGAPIKAKLFPRNLESKMATDSDKDCRLKN